ncbi:AI-2E family transporter [Paenibacillus puerhi]|uniref:AI-2E family transporter n=1 Tax=Paenibacillus puerhi TaxID=2692622 RepID=UPI001357E090|nr:AI-2E family transporter [Paenibacillus puerhi]
MNPRRSGADFFKRYFLNNQFVVVLLVSLLISLNLFVLNKIPFIFTPLKVLFKTILLPLILTGVAYYLLNPLVNWMERRHIKRIQAITALYLLLICLLTLLVFTVVPLIREQIMSLVRNFPAYSKQVELQFAQLLGSRFFNEVQQTLGSTSGDWTSSLSDKVTSLINLAGAGIGGFIGILTETVLTLAAVPFILFYLLKDGKKLPRYILKFVPTAWRRLGYTVLSEMNDKLSSYIRGQLIVSCCIGLLLYMGYLIIGLDYSLVLAVIAACTSIVPYLGPIIAITPALIVAAVTSPVMLLKMAAVWTVVQLIEGKVISPQIMGKSLHIHPVTIIFVILTAGNLFGLLGIILAVPGYAVLKVLARHAFRWIKSHSSLYAPRRSAEPSHVTPSAEALGETPLEGADR